MLVLLVLGVATGADNQISEGQDMTGQQSGAERRRGFWQVGKGDWQGGDRAVPLHLPEPAQAWEDESRLSHQAVHELKMLTTMLLKLTETLGSLGRVAVDHVSRANSSYGMRTRTRRPMHSRGSPSEALASAGPKMFRVLSPASPPPFVVSVVSCSYFRHCCSYSRLGHAHTTVTFVTT